MKSYSQQVYRATYTEMRLAMIGRFVLGGCAMVLGVLGANVASAQDVPGIEICTVEKTMERRTSCLQSNVEFLQKTIAKLTLDHQQKLDAAKAQIEALKTNLAALQKTVSDLQAAQQKPADEAKKAPDTAAKDAAAKDATKDAAAKDGSKQGAK
jgi:esterase/lipase